MSGAPALLADPAATPLRVALLASLALAPLAFGSVHEPAFVPLLLVCGGAGLASWARGHWKRAQGAGVPKLPGRRLLAALHGLVLFQLVPLPPFLLRALSPGSHAFWDHVSLVPLAAWRPVSVSPPDTLRGLAFLAAFTLLYGAAFRELGEPPWRRRLARTVVLVGLLMTLVGLVQAGSGQPVIYGLWRPTFDWAVFGPYVNASHFAGYLAMAIPLAFGFSLEALADLRRSWRRRRRGWLALGGHAGNALVRRSAEALALVVGLVACRSRGGMLAFGLSTLVLVFAAGVRRQGALLLAALAGLGVGWIGLGGFWRAMASRGVRSSRLELWADMLPLARDFPVFGAGFNAFGTAYVRYQTVWRREWIGEAHNEYLQLLFDLGLLGVALAAPLLWLMFGRAAAAARRAPLELGVLGALLALAFHALVDFNWQIPANAATYVALAGIAVRGARLDPPGGRP
jgi:O-antigen ligase